MTWPGGEEIAANAVVISPVITASHSLSNGAYGFDLNESNYAIVQTDAAPAWVQIDFGASQSIAQIRFRGGPDQSGSHAMVLKTSPDGSTWTTIASWTSQDYYYVLSPWFDVNRSDVRYIRFERSNSNNYLRLYYMGIKQPPASFHSIDPGAMAASPGLSGPMQLALPSSELAAAPALSLAEIVHGWFLSPDPLAASLDLSAGLRVDLAVPGLAASPGLSGPMQLALPSAELAAAPELSITEVLLGWYLFPDPLAASPGLSAGLRVDLAVPELAAAAALSGGLLVSIPADLGVVAEMSVVALSSFGSSDFVITYLCRLTPRAGSAFSEIILPMSSFQGRFKSGDPSFLSVIVPGGDYAQAISDRNDPDDPPELSVYMVKTFVNGNVISERLMAVDLEDVRIYEGATNVSIELEGHRTVSYSPKAVTLSGASYKNYSAGKLRYRCEPDLYLRPGDVVTVDGETFTADNISIAMAVNAQTMEVAES